MTVDETSCRRSSSCFAIAALCLLSSPVAAQLDPEGESSDPPAVRLEGARNRFEFGDCAGAVAILKEIAEPGVLEAANELVDAYRILGVCAAQRDDEVAARAWFKQLLYIDLEHRLDAFRTPPPVVDLFESARREVRDERDRVDQARKDADKGEKPSRFVVIERERVVVETPLAVAFVPFGVPQFHRDAPVTGASLLAVQSSALAINFGAMISYNVFDAADGRWDGRPGSKDQESAMNAAGVVAWTSAVAFGLAWGYGVVEALWNYEAERTGPMEQTTKEITPEQGETLLRRLGE